MKRKHVSQEQVKGTNMCDDLYLVWKEVKYQIPLDFGKSVMHVVISSVVTNSKGICAFKLMKKNVIKIIQKKETKKGKRSTEAARQIESKC